MMKRFLKFLKDEEGIEIVEWALMCAGFAIAMLAVFPTLVTALGTFYNKVSSILAANPT